MKTAQRLAGLCMLLGVSAAVAQDAPGTRVIHKEVVEQTAASTSEFDNVGFQQRYQQHGRPVMAIFWNREVTDVLTQWQVRTRAAVEQVNAERKTSGSDATLEEQSIAATRRFDEQNVGTQEGLNNMALASREHDVELGVAFTQSLLNAGVALVDRELVMRLAQRVRKADILQQTASDYYEIEMDALAGYADYVAEVLLVSAAADARQLSLLVNIKDVMNGRIIGTFLAKADTVVTNNAGDQNRVEWRAGPAGYERKVTIPAQALDMTVIGTEIARQTLEVLDRYWQLNLAR